MIILPALIWGRADNIFVKQGLQNSSSVQIPSMIKLAIKLDKAAYVGEGKNFWPHVHVDEGEEAVIPSLACPEIRQVGKFFQIIFDAIVSRKQLASGRDGYYFLESGEYTQLSVVQVIAKALYARGKVASPEAVQLSEADLVPEPYKALVAGVGSNIRARGGRSRKLGWNPPQTTEDFFASVRAEVDYLLEAH